MSKLWGGRFEGGLDEAAKKFSYSYSWDKRLYKQDIAVNKAHAKALNKTGILTDDELKKLSSALDKLLTQTPQTDAEDEDIHSYVERQLVESLGDLGKKIHTGKSRNDQVATDTRLYLKEELTKIDAQLSELIKTLITFAETHIDTIFPGFTHLQIAQPVLFAHHILAYAQKIKRDKSRLKDAFERADECPLGSAALAGSNYPLDREFLAKELGFREPTQNSMDAVSDRDFILETLSAASIFMAHMSQLSEELILWSSPLLGFIEIGDAYTTGSSIMPQKKNPDIAELIRGKTGPTLGHFVALHETSKGLPMTYNRDLQDDKKHLFACLDDISTVITCMTGMIPTITLNQSPIQVALEKGFILATEIADYLVLKQVPFRDAHEITGKIVRYAIENQKKLEDLSLEEFQNCSNAFDEDILDSLTLEKAICRKNLLGGTSTDQVKNQIKRLKEQQ